MVQFTRRVKYMKCATTRRGKFLWCVCVVCVAVGGVLWCVAVLLLLLIQALTHKVITCNVFKTRCVYKFTSI
jgi:hypothetical protein